MTQTPLFEFKTNPFKAVFVSSKSLPLAADEFAENLKQALAQWREAGMTSVWLKIPIEKSNLILVAVEQGFTFHHCHSAYLMLTLRLVADTFLPPYATHYAGVGGVVLNSKRKLLVIVERSDEADKPNYYKLPGGALEEGEHIVEGAIREVREETGMLTRFESLVCFRHWHGYRHGKSDFYFVCRLSPLSEAITIQEAEIHKCRWMPVDEFLELESVGVFNKRIVEAALGAGGMVSSWFDGYDKNPSTREIFLPM